MAVDVRTICLGLLSLGPATGYEIKKKFEEGPIGYFLEASFGAIYPALGRLTDEGFIDCRTERQDGKPDRKIYSLTRPGEKAFAEALKVSPGPDRFRSEFLFLLLFAELLPKEHLRELVDERLTDYRAKLGLLERLGSPDGCALPPGMEFVRGQAVAVYRAIIAYTEQNQHILEIGTDARLSAHAAE
jgi:DNA-binding PadR family transcriptional regulator